MSNPYYPAAGAPPSGHAFPVLNPSGYGPAKTMSNAAAHKISLGPGTARGNNIRGMARAANEYARLPPGTAKARQGPKGNVYIEAKHLPVEGWGGEPEVVTHFTGHVSRNVKGPTIGPAAPAIGQFHVKTAGVEGERYLATAVPRGRTVPNFSYMATPARHVEKAYPAGNRSAEVALGLAGAFTDYARLHPAPAGSAAAGWTPSVAAPQGKSGAAPAAAPKGKAGNAPSAASANKSGSAPGAFRIIRRGGRKSRKQIKKTRRGKSRKH